MFSPPIKDWRGIKWIGYHKLAPWAVSCETLDLPSVSATNIH